MTRRDAAQYLVGSCEEACTTTIFVTSEIDEGDISCRCLIVLSRAPARVATVMDVNLPRPRHLEMLSSSHYADIKRAALEVLYAEAVAAFARMAKHLI